MRVIVNPDVPKKIYVVAAVACAAATVLLAATLVRLHAAAGGYREAEAAVLSVSSEVRYPSARRRGASTVHCVYYRFAADGKAYSGKFRTFFPFIFKKGQTVTVLYDPDAPSHVMDRFADEASVVSIAVLFVFLVFLAAAIREKAREERTPPGPS